MYYKIQYSEKTKINKFFRILYLTMTDNLTKEKRSWNMSRIKGKNTKSELTVRSILHSMGFRFRIHRKDLPGTPDIVLPKYKTVIFVNGCFWHQHYGCKYATRPKSNQDFWDKKLNKNIDRDKENYKKLKELGFKVILIWECEIEKIITKEKNRRFAKKIRELIVN